MFAKLSVIALLAVSAVSAVRVARSDPNGVRPLNPIWSSNPGVRPLNPWQSPPIIGDQIEKRGSTIAPISAPNPHGVGPLNPVWANPSGQGANPAQANPSGQGLNPWQSTPIIGDHIEKRGVTGTVAAATIDGLKLLAIGNSDLLRQLDGLRHDVLDAGADVSSILAHAQDLIHRVVYKRDNNLSLVYNSLELLASNAFNLLVASGKSDVAQALYNQLVDLVNKAEDGSIELQDAFNTAVQDISDAINNASGKRELAARGNDVVQNTLNLVQILANNAITLLKSTGRSDVANVLISQINKLKDEALDGTLDLGDVVQAANKVIASYL